MISKFGSTVSICFSSCDVCGKTSDRVASMGVTASPGRFTTKDIDSIARSVSSVIGFFPVWIMAEAMPYRRPSPFPGLSPGLAVQMKGWVKK